LQVSVVYDDLSLLNHLNELHPMGEGRMALETAAGQVFLEASDEAMTPLGALSHWRHFLKS
jgi:hypothetical protein